MTIAFELLMAVGGAIALLAGVGLLRFESSYARLHAAGKASPVAFLVTAIGAAGLIGWEGSAYLAITAVAMVLTLPLGVHLLFRAVHRTTSGSHLTIDELAAAEARTTTEQR